jgi:crotonobetaine/carnitine-CoA ligase
MPVESKDLLPRLVRSWAERADRPFLAEVTGRAQTYAQTDLAGLRWASALRGLGIGAGDRVLVFMPPMIETANIWIALGWLRAIEVPVNTEYRGSMLKYIIDSARAGVMVCAQRFLPSVLELADQLDGELRTILVVRETADWSPPQARFALQAADALLTAAGEPDAEQFPGPEPHDVTMIMYTSGTTGVSKGVITPWGSVATAGGNAGPAGGFAADDIFYSTLPMYHAGVTNWLHGIARVGGQWIIRERFSTAAFWEEVNRHACTTTFLLGAMANFLARQPAGADDATTTMRSMVAVPLPNDVDMFEKRFGVRVYGMYGSTEIGIAMKTGRDRVDPRSCGRLLPGYQARVVDERDREVPHGRTGELIMRPQDPWSAFAGYFDMPEATVAAWRNLWFHTGDAMWRDEDGNFYFADRLKDSIRRRGENVSSAEVEEYLLRIDAVLECAAVPVPSEWGEDEVKIFVALKPGHVLDEAAIIARLADDKMPRFMVPRFVELVAELPKTLTGKVQKNLLRERDNALAWDRERREARGGVPGSVPGGAR